MNVRKNLHWLIYPLFVLSCARQTSPTGGPKDSIPPFLISSNPLNEETNYTKPSIELTFNEALILNTPKDQIIITPDVGKDFEAEVKKNKVTVQFKNDLLDNTTYSVNFREAVQDITEKNPVQNLKLAFSTGDYIDSLSIEGKIYDLLKSTEIKDATVALYETDTFNIFQHHPSYITKTDIKGNFAIGNLKPGDYYIYAMDDKNKNLVVDSKSESYGFIAEKLSLTENIKGVDMPLVRLDARPLKLTSARPSGTYFNIKTSKSLTTYRIKAIETGTIISSFGEDPANIRIYNSIGDRDSILINFQARDSIDNAIDTTLYLKFSKRTAKPETFKMTSNGFSVIGTKGILKGKLSFNKPLLSISYDSIFYQIDSTNIIRITSEDISIDTANNILSIEKHFDKTLLIKKPPVTEMKKDTVQRSKKPVIQKEQKGKPEVPKPVENQFYIGNKTFISVELDSSQAFKETLKPTTLESTGVIIVHADTDEKSLILQLLAKDYRVTAATRNSEKTTFEDLNPGDFQIRLIIDKNQDGKWTAGNFFKKEQPEPILFYKNEKAQTNVNLKANWELGPLLIKY